ncbi:segregation/condensation protein A [Candidatus Pacearchaeota archaeon]|nr:segregation/condensation protein A [Candidatus Pacearchaeota archaeon]
MEGKEKVGQEQIHGLLFGDKLSWQSLIYDLINSEQLDPWDIDLSVLSQKYLVKVRELEEANFFVSSKVLLAAALLLRMKSEILLEEDLQELDAILFGRKEEKKYVQERIELEDEIPGLVPRTPLPRFKKVTLHELMRALGNALQTETRRIKRVVVAKQQELETALSLPKQKINIKDQIHAVYSKLKTIFSERTSKLAFSELAGESMEDRIATFVPLLHLDNQHKVWVEQEGHLEEIWIWLKTLYEKENAPLLEEMRKEVEEAMKEFNATLPEELKEEYEEVENDFGNTLSNLSE